MSLTDQFRKGMVIRHEGELFVVLDVYRHECDSSAKPHNWDWTLGLPQYTWLKNTLEGSHAKESLETSKSMPSILNP